VSWNILLVEDNRRIQQNNRALFERSGYVVRLAMNLAEARKELAAGLPDVVVLDITLPDGNGLDILKDLRRSSGIPVLLLTARDSPEDTVAGLDAGSDDYLSKPYNIKVLRARVEALLRRASKVPETIVMDRLSFDVTASIAMLDGQDLMLTQKEFAMLLLFVQNEEQFMSAEYLYEKVWGSSMADDRNAIKGVIKRLRSKIDGSGYRIVWSRGEGYGFDRE
jgi:DNA-binding response OmpR family regulator